MGLFKKDQTILFWLSIALRQCVSENEAGAHHFDGVPMDA
jgi:hypothetical protein